MQQSVLLWPRQKPNDAYWSLLWSCGLRQTGQSMGISFRGQLEHAGGSSFDVDTLVTQDCSSRPGGLLLRGITF
jgi:hypothetical protein